MASAQTQYLPKDIDPEVFRRLVLRNDGLPIDFNELERPRTGKASQ